MARVSVNNNNLGAVKIADKYPCISRRSNRFCPSFIRRIFPLS